MSGKRGSVPSPPPSPPPPPPRWLCLSTQPSVVHPAGLPTSPRTHPHPVTAAASWEGLAAQPDLELLSRALLVPLLPLVLPSVSLGLHRRQTPLCPSCFDVLLSQVFNSEHFLLFVFLILTQGYFYIYLQTELEGERGEERERKINVRETHRLVATHRTPTRAREQLQLRYVIGAQPCGVGISGLAASKLHSVCGLLEIKGNFKDGSNQACLQFFFSKKPGNT
uniref:Uncharacterized protein n=1 Tax=Molossus molossus TaxID=27622 RepID=A0A7J8JWY3_MOLMO|nr:hypothetical protein HJG59_008017 [Molossus molossus]